MFDILLTGVKYIWIWFGRLMFALLGLAAVALGFIIIYMWVSTGLIVVIQPHLLAVIVSAVCTTLIEAFIILSFIAFLKSKRSRLY